MPIWITCAVLIVRIVVIAIVVLAPAMTISPGGRSLLFSFSLARRRAEHGSSAPNS